MALPKQIIPMNFREGLNNKSDNFLNSPGELLKLSNGNFDKIGAINLRKGNTQVLPPASLDASRSAGFGIDSFGDKTLASDGYHLYVEDDTAGLLDVGGTIAPITVDLSPLVAAARCSNPSVNVFGANSIVAYETTTGIDIQVYGPTKDLIFTRSYQGRSKPLVVVGASDVHVWAFAQISNNLDCFLVDITNKNVTEVLFTPATSTFYVWQDSTSTSMNLIYQAVTNGPILWSQVASNGTLTHTLTLTTSRIPETVTGLTIDANTIAVYWAQDNDGHPDFYSVIFNPTTVAVTIGLRLIVSTTQIEAVVNNMAAVLVSGVVHLYYDLQTSPAVHHFVMSADYTHAISDSVLSLNLYLAGSPFLINSSAIGVPCLYKGAISALSTYFLLDGDSASTGKSQILSRFGIGAGGLRAANSISQVVGPAPFTLAVPMYTLVGQAFSLVEFDPTLHPMQSSVLGSLFYTLFGSRLYLYDGINTVVEDGFDVYPEYINLPAPTGSAHKYGYQAVYSWTDGLGLEHLSSPCPVSQMQTANPIGVGGGTESVTLTIPRYVLPTAKSGIAVKLYRTVDAGTDPKLIKTFDNLTDGGSDPLFISYTDSAPDNIVIATAISAPGLPVLEEKEREIPSPSIWYTVGNSGGELVSGTTYKYRITALTQYGETNYQEGIDASFTADSSHHSAINYWDAIDGATGYNVYRAVSPFTAYYRTNTERISASTTNNIDYFLATTQIALALNSSASGRFPNTGVRANRPVIVTVENNFTPVVNGSLALNTRYYYRITAINAYGETLAGNEGTGTPLSFVSVSTSSGALKLTWTSVSGATNYKIYRSWKSNFSPLAPLFDGNETLLTTVGAVTTYTDATFSDPTSTFVPHHDTSADVGGTLQTNYYKVTAVNSIGETTGSTEANIVLDRNTLPAGVNISWPGVNGAVSYNVYRSTSSNTETFLVNTTALSYLDVDNDTTATTVPVVNTTKPLPINGIGVIEIYTGSTLGGGQVANLPAPSTNFLTTHQNRLFGINTDVENQIWYSDVSARGFAMETNPLIFFVDLPPVGGKVIGLASLDDKLVVYKERCIYVIFGTGPDATGGNGSFNTPQLLTSDVGLQDPKSIVRTPNGVMFRSHKGIYQLTRDLAVSYAGMAVEDELGSDTVVASILAPSTNEVRFYTSIKVLAHNYLIDTWGTHSIVANAATVNPSTGQINLLVPNGAMWRESTGFTDPTGVYTLQIQTAWLALNTLQGFGLLHYIMLLGHYKNTHSLKADIEYNYDPSTLQTVTIPVTSGVVGQGPEQYRIGARTHRCSAIRLTLTITGVGSDPCALTGLGFEVSPKAGFKRVGTSQKYAVQ